jgi:hypothetical protein
VLGVKEVLGVPVLVPIVVTEIELARTYIVLHSDHAFKEFECASVGFYFHGKLFMVEMKKIMENCMDFSTGPIRCFSQSVCLKSQSKSTTKDRRSSI